MEYLKNLKHLPIPDTNVIDIISCVDSNGKIGMKLIFAQDKVPIETHYTDDVIEILYMVIVVKSTEVFLIH